MRAPVLITALFLGLPSLAWAAPTCQNRDGITTRCGTPGAMPVGWEPSPQDLLQRPQLPGPNHETVWTAIALLGLLFSLIALMPRFDGASDDDWQPPGAERK